MGVIEITLGLLLAIAAVAALGKWVPVPLPILLVVGGIALSYLPGYDELTIEPETFFLLFIPPLLFADGWLIPKRDLLRSLRPVLLLAFGLVFLTTVVVGYLMHWLIPSLPLSAAFALGAVISPTDAVAVSAITSRLNVPSRVTTILKGESLINDASGLVAFKFAVAAAATGTFSWSDATLQFFLQSGGGFALGLAVAWLIGHLRAALTRFCMDDPLILTVLSLLTPFAAYLAGEAAHVGSILAVVGAALYAGAHDVRIIDAPTRAHSWEVWRMLQFSFNGLVFLILGVQLHSVVAELSLSAAIDLARYALILSAAVIALRLAWVFPASWLPLLMSKQTRDRLGRRTRIGDSRRCAVDTADNRNRGAFPRARSADSARGKRYRGDLVAQRDDASVFHSLAEDPRRRRRRARRARGANCDRAGGHRGAAPAPESVPTRG